MLDKFKNLTPKKKVTTGIIAFILLPLTVLVLGIYLLFDGVKQKKAGKIIVGLVLTSIIIAICQSESTTNPTIDNSNEVAIESSNEEVTKPSNEDADKSEETTKEDSQTQEQEDSKVENTLTNDELIEKLETYEGIYSLVPLSIEEASTSNDSFKMQQTFANGRDVLEKGWKELSSLKYDYDKDSDEYKAIDNLHLAFFTLRDACKHGIKYIDKNEYKYFEKYESDCNLAGAFISDYLKYKEKIK